MAQITVLVPDELAASLDAAAASEHRHRTDLIRQALEQYLEEYDDHTVAVERLQDPSDPVLDWNAVRNELLGSD